MKHRCDEVRALAGDFADVGAASVEERAMLDEHLGECGDCLAALKGMVVQRSVLRAVLDDRREAPPLPESLVSRYVKAMKTAAGDARAGARTA